MSETCEHAWVDIDFPADDNTVSQMCRLCPERRIQDRTPVHEYTVRVSQERNQFVVVKASSPHEANQIALDRALRMPSASWNVDAPKASFVHVNFDVERHDD